MMRNSHPDASPNGIVVGAVELMPILGRTKLFHTWDETTVCTVECEGNRGAIAIGFSKHNRDDGVATYSTISEAKVIVTLIQNAIADAERIERGVAPLAHEGRNPPPIN
tara:strand:+ start:243 stop:569 length:327 start_codon:yes stop_codon:yes gene_type:complete